MSKHDRKVGCHYDTINCTDRCEDWVEYIYIIDYNFLGVQASGLIVVYCDSAISYDPKL